MKLHPNEQSLIQILTDEWQTPIQIVEQLHDTSIDLSSINQSLKDLMQNGLIQANPVIFGMYRLTSEGHALKQSLLRK